MRSKHHEDMIFDGYPGHVMSGTSLIITTALIVVLHCQSAAGNCSYKQTVYEWQKYIPRDYRLEIPLSCGDKILCEDIKRALLISHCQNLNCTVKHGASNSCEATYRKTKELIRCFDDLQNPNCSNIKEVQIQNQAQRKYMLIGDMLSEKINGCLEKKETGDDCSEFTSPAKTTTPTTSIIPTTPSPTIAEKTYGTDSRPSESSTQAAFSAKTNRTDSRPSEPSTVFSAKTTTPTTRTIPTTPSPTIAEKTYGTDSIPSESSTQAAFSAKTNRTDSRPSPSTAFSETSEKSVVGLLMISLCLNVALVLLLLKQKRRQTQLLNRNGYMPTNVSTQEDSSL